MATSDGETFYLTFAKDNAVYRFVRSAGSFERWCDLPAFAAPRALALNGDELYVVDPFHLLIYVVDTSSARTTGEALYSRNSGYTAVAFFDGTFYMYDRDDDGIWRLPMQRIGDSIIRSDPTRVGVRARLTVRNTSPDNPVKDVRCVVAVPVTEVHQTIESITYQGPGPSLEWDRYGQLVVVFDEQQISPGGEAVVGWTVDAVIWNVRHHVPPSNLRPFGDIPADVATLYGTTSYYRLSEGDPTLDRLARDIAVTAGNNPVDLVRSTRDAVMDRLTYELHYPWREAADILRVGKGTCGEYSFLTSALLRRNGLPTRFIGASTNRHLTACTDTVFHGWIEVYLPGYGWAPMDTNYYDNDEGPPYRNRLVFGENLNKLVVSRGGHEDENYLGPNYNYNVTITSGTFRSGIAYDWEIR
jgi:transglutaminase-like putative cysteine protease